MSRRWTVGAIVLGALILLAIWQDAAFIAVLLSAPFGYVVARPMAHKLLDLPATWRWYKHRHWQGEFRAFDDFQVRFEAGETPADFPVVVIADVERAIKRRLGKVSTEFVATEGLLAGLRCAPADTLLQACLPYERGGVQRERMRANEFNRWFRATFVAPVWRELERRQAASRQQASAASPGQR